MKTKKAKHYYDNCWQQNYYFCIGWTHDEFTRYLFKHTGIQSSKYQPNLMGRFQFDDDSGHMYIWVKKRKGIEFYADLAHECAHAALKTLEERGSTVSWSNDEHFTYLLSCLIVEAGEK